MRFRSALAEAINMRRYHVVMGIHDVKYSYGFLVLGGVLLRPQRDSVRIIRFRCLAGRLACRVRRTFLQNVSDQTQSLRLFRQRKGDSFDTFHVVYALQVPTIPNLGESNLAQFPSRVPRRKPVQRGRVGVPNQARLVLVCPPHNACLHEAWVPAEERESIDLALDGAKCIG